MTHRRVAFDIPQIQKVPCSVVAHVGVDGDVSARIPRYEIGQFRCFGAALSHDLLREAPDLQRQGNNTPNRGAEHGR